MSNLKSRLLVMIVSGAMVLTSRSASYTNSFVCGSNLISNPLGVSIDELIPYPPNFSVLYKWNQASQTFDDIYVYSFGAWDHGNITLSPGESALFVAGYDMRRCPGTNIVTGVQGESALPIPFTRNSYRAVSRQVPGLGTYENIVGLPPEAGSKFICYDRNAQAWVTNIFNGSGHWHFERSHASGVRDKS